MSKLHRNKNVQIIFVSRFSQERKLTLNIKDRKFPNPIKIQQLIDSLGPIERKPFVLPDIDQTKDKNKIDQPMFDCNMFDMFHYEDEDDFHYDDNLEF